MQSCYIFRDSHFFLKAQWHLRNPIERPLCEIEHLKKNSFWRPLLWDGNGPLFPGLRYHFGKRKGKEDNHHTSTLHNGPGLSTC